MKGRTQTIHRMMIIVCTVGCAVGVLVYLLAFLSNASAAAESLHSTRVLGDVSSERWRILADMHKERGHPGVVAYDDKIYVMGGYFPRFSGYNQTQEVYDPHTDTWQFLKNLPVARSDLMTANVADKLYAIGGWNLNLGGPVSYTHRYDPVADNWITKTAMITPVSGAGVAVLTDTVVPTTTIYILGGFDGLESLGAVQKYDPINDTWSLGTPMSVPRSELGAVFLNGEIYTIGGVTNQGGITNIVEIYNPISDTWKMGTPLPEVRGSMAVGVRQGKIYVIGGTDNWSTANPKNTAFVFDPGSGLWSTVNSMPTTRTACRAAVVNDIIYVIGGKGDPGAGSANEGYGFQPITSTTRISSDNPEPSQINQPFTISYTVTASGEIPTGVVTVTVDNRQEICTGSLANAMGSCQLALNTLGAYSLTATYGGNHILLGSSDTESHAVVKADSNTTIIADNPDPSVLGQPITVTFTVSSPFGVPSGSVLVTASNSLESCSGNLINGSGNCPLTINADGTYTLTATYSGDTNFNPSSDTEPHVVVKADTNTTITADNPDPSVLGQPITVTFTVSSSFGVPSGSVLVTASNSLESCSGSLINGSGNCPLTINADGTYRLTATYSGDTNFNPSGDTEPHVVEPKKVFLPFSIRQ
jgi:N-acetylneuraminic acid mutarotase